MDSNVNTLISGNGNDRCQPDYPAVDTRIGSKRVQVKQRKEKDEAGMKSQQCAIW